MLLIPAQHPARHPKMNDPPNSELSPADLRLQSFNERALSRMFRTLLVVSVLLLGLRSAIRLDWRAWICRWSCDLMHQFPLAPAQRGSSGDRIVNRQSQEKGGRIVWRFSCVMGCRSRCLAIFKGSPCLPWFPVGFVFARGSHDDRGGVRSFFRI